MPTPDQETLDRLVHCVILAADRAAIATPGTRAKQTRAALTEALKCAISNGLITVTPPGDWPDYIVVDPPYRLPGTN